MARKQKLVEAEQETEDQEEVLDNQNVDETEEEAIDEVGEEDEDEDEEVEESAASDTLHPGAGSGGGIQPTRMETISAALGLLSKVDQDTLKYFNGMMSSHFGKDFGVPGGAKDKNQNSIDAHPSKAVGGGKSKEGMPPQGAGTADGNPLAKVGHGMNEVIKQEVSAIFEGQELSPEFKEKATVLFEAALGAKVAEETAKLEEAYEAALEEEVQKIHEAVEHNVEIYCEHVAQEWMKENEVAIESSLRNEIVTEFMTKLRDLFIDCNVNIPQEQVEVVDALAEKVDDLEARLAEAIKENAELREVKERADRSEAVAEAVKGLTLADSEKVKTLVEGVEAESLEEFNKKLGIIKDSLKKSPKKSTVQNLMEEVSEDNMTNGEDKPVSPQMKKYVDVLNRTVPRTAS